MLLCKHPHFWYKTAEDCGFVPDILYLNFWFLVSRCVTAWLTVPEQFQYMFQFT